MCLMNNKNRDLRCEMRCSQRKRRAKTIISNSYYLHPLQEARSLLTFRDFKTHLYLPRWKRGTLLCSQNPFTVGCWVASVFCSLPKGTSAVQRRKKPFNYLVRRSSWSIRYSAIRIFKLTVDKFWYDAVIPERLLLNLILLKSCKMQNIYHIASCSSSCCRWWKQFQGHM